MELGGGDYLSRAKGWQATKFDHGFARITWEPEFGGRNGTSMQQIIFGQEEGKYTLPTEAFVIGLGMIAPTIKAVGTDAQKQRYLTKLLRGEELWCQLFSEPGAGSDVASLSTAAVRDGDEWVINGQKVWTSGAQFSDYGEIICRTAPDAEKHKGITAFIVDMRAPGVTIKPLKQMNGGAAFNEVFFEDVRVPHDYVLGDVNEGWSVAITTLMNERVAIGSAGGGGGAGGRGTVHDVIALAKERGASGDPRIRQQLADLYSKTRIQRFLSMRTLTAASRGKIPGPEGSIGKLFGARITTQLGELTCSLAGPEGVAGDDAVRAGDTDGSRRSHRRRLRRGDEEHPRRARARSARRAPARQGRGVERRSPVAQDRAAPVPLFTMTGHRRGRTCEEPHGAPSR